jgi:hypothetical protein
VVAAAGLVSDVGRSVLTSRGGDTIIIGTHDVASSDIVMLDSGN